MDNTAIKLLHEWTVSVNREVDETRSETINGQTVQVTRKVTKEVLTKFAIKLPTRKELKAAELFYGKEFNRFFSMGFIPRSILINKHMDLSGGVISEKERSHIADLLKKSSDLEADLIRISTTGQDQNLKKIIEAKIATIRTEMVNLQVANESVFSQTADAKAQSQLNIWFALFLILIEKNGKWTQYFHGDTFEEREEDMWQLEENNDEVYLKAVPEISKCINIFISGGDTVEKFKISLDWLDKEAKKQVSNIDENLKENNEKEKLSQEEKTEKQENKTSEVK